MKIDKKPLRYTDYLFESFKEKHGLPKEKKNQDQPASKVQIFEKRSDQQKLKELPF